MWMDSRHCVVFQMHSFHSTESCAIPKCSETAIVLSSELNQMGIYLGPLACPYYIILVWDDALKKGASRSA